MTRTASGSNIKGSSTLENVALEANMPKVVEDCTILDRYKNLLRENLLLFDVL